MLHNWWTSLNLKPGSDVLAKHYADSNPADTHALARFNANKSTFIQCNN